MLKTATQSSHPFGSENSTPPAESPRQSRAQSRTYLDVFNPPLDLHNVSSPGSSPAIRPSSPGVSAASPRTELAHPAEVTCSPCSIPNSFSSYSAQPQDVQHSRGTPSSPPPNNSIGGQSPSLMFTRLPGSPALNFRKTRSSASLSRDLEDFHLGEALSSPGCGAGSGILHHHHHHHSHYHHQHSASHSPLVSSFSPEDRKGSSGELCLTQEDLDATATTEEVNNPHLLSKFHNAPLSPPPSAGRRGSIGVQGLAENLPAVVPIEDTTISSSIPLYQMPAEMLVPLLDRPKDMSNLVKHPCRTRFMQILKNSLGDDVFENQLLKIWLEADRNQMSDAEWLWKTKLIILQRAGAGSACRDGKLWGDFCDMVGWDEDDLSIDPTEERRSGTPIEAMEKIAEDAEEEEEERKEEEEEKKEEKQ